MTVEGRHCSFRTTAKRNRVLTTMVADAMHVGHVNHILKSREAAERRQKEHETHDEGQGIHLIVGVHSDEAVMSYKRRPLFNMNERMAHVRQSPGVDEVMPDAPLKLTLDYLDSIDVTYVCGNLMVGDSIEAREYNSMYMDIVRAGRFLNIPRTEGISTTDILDRVVARQKSGELL